MKALSGFTLIEAVTALAIVGILAATVAPLTIHRINRKREEITIERLKDFKRSIIGNPEMVIKEVRASFGYLGDMGTLPQKLEDLYVKGNQPAFQYNTHLKIGAGWNGPYTDPQVVEDFAYLKFDGFGKEYLYSTAESKDPGLGVTVVGKITSPGLDGIAGGPDDLSIKIFHPEVFSRVIGFVKDAEGNRAPGVSVKINFPQRGMLTEARTTTDGSGLFSFDGIPYGNRSITLEPRLVYAPGSGITRTPSKNDVELKITNFAPGPVSIASIRIDYTVSPNAFYSEVVIAGQRVFFNPNLKGQSGQTLIFPPINIRGSGATQALSFPIRIQSPTTQLGELKIKGGKQGDTVKIELKDFEDIQTAGGNSVNMAGVSFRLTFSDGSTVLFAPR